MKKKWRHYSVDEAHDIFHQLHVRWLGRKRHYLRYGVGAGTDGRDLKPRFELPMFVEKFHRFCVWGLHVYIACGNHMAVVDFPETSPTRIS
jgi:hypothetical protein